MLIDWNPRHLYRKLIEDEVTMEWFLAEVCHTAWNEEQDRGRSFAAAIEEAAARHPEYRPLIEAYFERWAEMMAGEIEGAVAILEELKDAGYELHALTNWSAETFPRPRPLRLPRVVRDHPGLCRRRPDQARPRDLPAAARAHRAHAGRVHLYRRQPNVAAAAALGFDAIAFHSAAQLRDALAGRGCWPALGSGSECLVRSAGSG